jgi:hypothetical protein
MASQLPVLYDIEAVSMLYPTGAFSAFGAFNVLIYA